MVWVTVGTSVPGLGSVKQGNGSLEIQRFAGVIGLFFHRLQRRVGILQI